MASLLTRLLTGTKNIPLSVWIGGSEIRQHSIKPFNGLGRPTEKGLNGRPTEKVSMEQGGSQVPLHRRAWQKSRLYNEIL